MRSGPRARYSHVICPSFSTFAPLRPTDRERVPGFERSGGGATDNGHGAAWVSGITRGVWRRALVASALLFFPSLAHAEPACPNVVGGERELDAIPMAVRSRWLDATLGHESSKAKVWTWTWVALGTAGTAANLTVGALVSYHPRVDRFVAAGSTFGLAVSTLLFPLRIRTDDGALSDDDCSIVVRRERLLLDAVEREERGRRWFAHALGVVGGLTAGAILGFGYDHWSAAAINAIGSVVVNEVKIWTRPAGAVAALRRYREGALPVDGYIGFDVVPVMVGPASGGAALMLTF